MEIKLDVAAVLAAVVWPAVLIVLLLMFRNRLPAILAEWSKRVTKLGFAGINIELATAKESRAEWKSAVGPDLRRAARSVDVNDSTQRTFITQLRDTSSADYAVADLGAGHEWLTSRLFIMAILYARAKNLTAFVFLESVGDRRRRFVGWAEPDKIRWALARKCPWLESAYAGAYEETLKRLDGVVADNAGRLGSSFDPADPQPGVALLSEYLRRIQCPPEPQPVPSEDAEWVDLDGAGTKEHASWVTGRDIEELLKDDLNTARAKSSELRGKEGVSQLRTVVSSSGRFAALTDDDGRFESLLDRQLLIEKLAEAVTRES